MEQLLRRDMSICYRQSLSNNKVLDKREGVQKLESSEFMKPACMCGNFCGGGPPVVTQCPLGSLLVCLGIFAGFSRSRLKFTESFN